MRYSYIKSHKFSDKPYKEIIWSNARQVNNSEHRSKLIGRVDDVIQKNNEDLTIKAFN